MIAKISSDEFRTHMPFEMADENGESLLFYCRSSIDDIRFGAVSTGWKLWLAQSNHPPRRLETGLSEDTTECAPTAWCDESGWHVTFIGGARDKEKTYYLYRMSGPSLDALSLAIPISATQSGFVWRNRTVTSYYTDIIQVRGQETFFDLEVPGAFIGRVSYLSENPNRLLIGAQFKMETEELCIEYDLISGKQSLLVCDDRPAYKCSIFGSSVLYTRQSGQHRSIYSAETFHRRAFQGIRKRSPGEVRPLSMRIAKSCGGCAGVVDLGPNTRASCLECVEKHLGAVYVLLTECRDGYAHRLRAVGHFHEAEDESQAWSKLHAAIRKARKAYQMQEAIPDWQRFEDLIRTLREESTLSQEAPDAILPCGEAERSGTLGQEPTSE